MFYQITRVMFSLISSLFMLRFALPKLQAMEVSVKSFAMFSSVLPINPKFFMYFTGSIELFIFALLFSSLFIKNSNLKKKFQIIGFISLFFVMIGAIAIEQFVRPTPKPMLVTIAFVLLTISISELSILTQRKVN